MSHRILWTLLLCLVLLVSVRKLRFLAGLLQNPRQLGAITIAALLVATNWVIYVVAVTSDHVTEAALGYFLNPLVTVLLGVFVLGEKLRRAQWLAVGIGAVACVYLAINYGRPPWISIGLALSFAAYGLMKKRIGGQLSALESLSAETFVLSPLAVACLIWVEASGQGTWSTHGVGHSVLLVASGVATAIPLLLFAAAARRVPLTTIGLLQFMTPIMQLLCGVLVLGETMTSSRWIGFATVWLALAVLMVDMLQHASQARKVRRAEA